MRAQNRPQDLLNWLGIRDAPDWALARWLGACVSVLLTVLFALALAAAFKLLAGTVLAGPESGLGSLGAGALVVAILGAPFLIWSTVLKHQTLRYQKEGHITDRITSAVEQLGVEKTVERRGRTLFYKIGDEKCSAFEYDDQPFACPSGASDIKQREWVQMKRSEPNIEVRIGAILSLERIAQDSTTHDNGRDHVRVMEILCAYVRENAPATTLEPTPTPFKTRSPRQDIQFALNVIKRRSHAQIDLESQTRFRIDLSGTNLDGCDLSHGSFRGALFIRSRLEAANMHNSDLTGTRFDYSLLDYIFFGTATMIGTSLNHCTLDRAHTGFMSHASKKGVFIEAANVAAIRFGAAFEIKQFFGSRDTVVAFDEQNRMISGLQAGEDLSLLGLGEDACETDIGALIATPFSHWNPYSASDFAAPPIREKYRKELGLCGWPFDDA